MISAVIATLGCLMALHAFPFKMAFFLCDVFCFMAILTNYLFRPSDNNITPEPGDFKTYQSFPLEVLGEDNGTPYYVNRVNSSGGNQLIEFKSQGLEESAVSVKRFARDDVALIYDSCPHIRFYIATKKAKGYPLISLMGNTVTFVQTEIHCPDALAYFSGDKGLSAI